MGGYFEKRDYLFANMDPPPIAVGAYALGSLVLLAAAIFLILR